LVDLDADGRIDMLSGSYHPGSLFLFRRNDDDTFAAGEELKGLDGQPLNVGAAAHVSAADWTGDGRLDLVIGNIQGEVFLIPHTGSDEPLSFGEARPMEAAGSPVRVGPDAGPHVVDWNGDGKLDLLVGDGGGAVHFYRNVGEEGAPKLARPETLLPGGGAMVSESNGPAPKVPWGTRLKLHAADWNDDGKLDLLVGDFAMTAKQRDVTPEQKKRHEALSREYQEVIQRYSQLAAKAETGLSEEERKEQASVMERLTALSREMQSLNPVTYEYAGNVWVFLRE